MSPRLILAGNRKIKSLPCFFISADSFSNQQICPISVHFTHDLNSMSPFWNNPMPISEQIEGQTSFFGYGFQQKRPNRVLFWKTNHERIFLPMSNTLFYKLAQFLFSFADWKKKKVRHSSYKRYPLFRYQKGKEQLLDCYVYTVNNKTCGVATFLKIYEMKLKMKTFVFCTFYNAAVLNALLIEKLSGE